MKKIIYIKSLTRSLPKTIITLLMMATAAFLFLYNLSEYNTIQREYTEAMKSYQGVLTVEQSAVSELVDSRYNFFILTDETNPGRTFDRFSYDEFHHESIPESVVEELSNMPYITRVDRRYMTSGVSDDYWRMDNEPKYFNYGARCVLVGTLKEKNPADMAYDIKNRKVNSGKDLIIDDVQMLAGDERWLGDSAEQAIRIRVLDESTRDQYAFYAEGNNMSRFAASALDLGIFEDTLDALEIGHRYIFVLRNESNWGVEHIFFVGDDSLIGWWPYMYDVTDLPEGWLETDEFTPLRDLIKVTNDDLHTFDVVYTDDMYSISRVANERIICLEGRLLTPEDAGQTVCVVSAAFLEQNGLGIGDKVKLKIGNHLCEQYAPLGAVAVTKGRYASAFTEMEFTIVGSYKDLNDGAHINRDFYWCYSDNTIFVPSDFLPAEANVENHEFKPGELSFVVENAEDIGPFMEKCLPNVEQMGISYKFYDSGWLKTSEQYIQARRLAFGKLMIFSCAAIFAIILAVWLFVSRKKREYGILRAIGMDAWNASLSLIVPIAILGVISSILGCIAAAIVSNWNIEKVYIQGQTAAHPNFAVLVLGALVFFLLLLCVASAAVFRLRRKSVLRLLQEGTRK